MAITIVSGIVGVIAAVVFAQSWLAAFALWWLVSIGCGIALVTVRLMADS